MSKAEIIYSELTESAQVARRMSDGFQDYADELNRKIVNKLNGYSGNHTSRIEGAINSTNSKIHELEDDSQRFSTFATDIDSLREACVMTDVSVGSRITSLSDTFIDTNIVYSDNPILNGLGIATNWLLDNTPFGNDIRNAIITYRDIKSSVREWYRNGGKETLKLIFDVSIAVASVAIAICTCGVGGIIIASALAAWDIYNACYNYTNDTAALNYAKNGGDPVAARSMSRIDKKQDYLRSSFKADFSGQTYTYNKADEDKADLMDKAYKALSLANFFASIGAGKDGLLKDTNFYENGLSGTLSKGKDLVVSKFKNFDTTVSKQGLLSTGKQYLNVLGKNLKNEYNIKFAVTNSVNEAITKGKSTIEIVKAGTKAGFKAFKNIASVGQKVVDGKLTKPNDRINFVVNDVLLKGITFKQDDTFKFKMSDVFNFDINNIKVNPFNPVTPVSYEFDSKSFALYNKYLKCFS